MKQLNLFSILLFTFVLLLLAPKLTVALLTEEAFEIPSQINYTDRIVIGTVSEIHTYDDYTDNTITVKEWLYNPIPAETIRVRTEMGTNLWVEDEAEFTLNESVLLMLKDENIDKQLFRVPAGSKDSVSDRDAVIEELKAQGKWQDQNQIVNKTNNTGMSNNKGTASEQDENSNLTPKSKNTPFISPIWVLATVLGAVIYTKKEN